MRLVFFTIVCLAFMSCEVVKPYQKVFLNDEDMKEGKRLTDDCETAFETYREGASGGGSENIGGGCGCN